MIGVQKQAEVGVPVAEVIRKAGVREQTTKYAGLEVANSSDGAAAGREPRSKATCSGADSGQDDGVDRW
jgi:hypothetical protein